MHFVFAFTFSLIFIHARSQPGFISIDCGLPLESTNYNDTDSGIIYSTDHNAYIDGGVNSTVDANYIDDSIARHLQTVRYFPRNQGGRSCYDFASLQAANKRYLIRATFRYGNYDGRNQPPTFHLHLGGEFWDSVQLIDSISVITKEIIHVPSSNYLYVCLVDSGAGTPFISALELRLLSQYSYITEKPGQSLAFFRRWNFAPADPNRLIRYPGDNYDRLWHPYATPDGCVSLNTTMAVVVENHYAPPEAVMQSALAPQKLYDSLHFSWNVTDPKAQFYVYFHFAEVVKLGANDSRGLYIRLNDIRWLSSAVVPNFRSINSIVSRRGYTREKFDFSLVMTENSTLPPIINAMEVYLVKQLLQLQTHENDVVAMFHIKSIYGVKRGWQGDPCLPKIFIWDGLDCIFYVDMSIPPRVRFLNMSSNGLNGTVSSHFSNLTFLESLDLSNNNLRGSIPDFLSELPQLKVLNLSGNKFSGSIPQKLLDKANSGGLQLRADGYESGTPDKCEGDKCKTSNKSNKLLVILIVVPLTSSIMVISAVLILIWRFRRIKSRVPKLGSMSNRREEFLVSKNTKFTYPDILEMTKNHQKVLGKGGFGTVYHGLKSDGKEVAVKLLSRGSDQGYVEFQTEAQLLTRVHHRNLTCLVGYCYEGSHMALVYEYMANGNLGDRLSARNDGSVLSWAVRLQIALDTAQGLDYLHKYCKPPIVHRDVKPANILLNENFEAKLADFGFSRTYTSHDGSCVTTRVIGTHGYIDPEYHETRRLNNKSDIYSLGIVMLQLITGMPVMIGLRESQERRPHITEWVSSTGDIRSIVDPKMEGMYDINTVSKALELAMACASPASFARPTMAKILTELTECLMEEKARTGGGENDLLRETSGTIDAGNGRRLKKLKNLRRNHPISDQSIRIVV